MNPIFNKKFVWLFTQGDLFIRAWWIWLARTGKGHTVLGHSHNRPFRFGRVTIHQGPPSIASGHLAKAGPLMVGIQCADNPA